MSTRWEVLSTTATAWSRALLLKLMSVPLPCAVDSLFFPPDIVFFPDGAVLVVITREWPQSFSYTHSAPESSLTACIMLAHTHTHTQTDRCTRHTDTYTLHTHLDRHATYTDTHRHNNTQKQTDKHYSCRQTHYTQTAHYTLRHTHYIHRHTHTHTPV